MRDELYCKTVLYCGWKGCRRQNSIAIQNCIVTGGMGAGQALGARQGRWARGRGAGRAACAHGLVQLGARAPGLVFNLVFRLGIFPESPNDHCAM